jgi:hypothetical protein
MLTFRVKHFPAQPERIESEYVRYLFFLQERNYVLKANLELRLEDATQLAAFAIQATIGDFKQELEAQDYLCEMKFLASKYLAYKERIIDLHKQLNGKLQSQMELEFLSYYSQFDTYGTDLIIVKDKNGDSSKFGVSHRGIISSKYDKESKETIFEVHPWNEIGKITYRGRKLTIQTQKPEEHNNEIIKKRSTTFKCRNERICKHLWKFILDQRAFFGFDIPLKAKEKSSHLVLRRRHTFRFVGRSEKDIIDEQHALKLSTSLPIDNEIVNTSYDEIEGNKMNKTSSTISNMNNNTTFSSDLSVITGNDTSTSETFRR